MNAPLQSPPVDLLRELAAHYPQLAGIDHPDWQAIIARASALEIPAGTGLLTHDSHCEQFVLLLHGCVRVYQLAEDGREITLYRIDPGDICVLSLASLLHDRRFNAVAQAETRLLALALPAADFQQALAVAAPFRHWVLASISDSYSTVLDTFHGTVFNRLEMRLACLLGQRFARGGGTELAITHQQLARELGTTREVISRCLKQFEQQGCVELLRGRIRLLSPDRLAADRH